MLSRLALVWLLIFASGLPARAVELDWQLSVETSNSAEVFRLRQALAGEIRHAVHHDPVTDATWVRYAQAAAAASDMLLDRAQLAVVVDRNPPVQQLMIVLADPSEPWQVIGGSKVSTGQKGRFDHYVTPLGVFHITDAILGFRAEGTKNENGIRGLGAKGMRVWDFGWQVARKGWSEAAGKPDRTPIRLMLHATDPDRLEQRLGRPASQGCVRVPATMNRFLDQHGVLDADYERAAVDDIRFRALLLRGREPSSLAGNTLIVIDSSEQPAVVATSAPQTP